MRRKGLLFTTLLLAAGLVTGCGAETGNVEVFPVRGIVNLNGKPMLGGGSITFVPTGDQKGKMAGGVINEDGTYELTTYEEGDGSMVGDFRVVITQVTVKEPEPTEDGQPVAVEAVETVAEEDQIPLIYGDYEKSPLTRKVEAKDNDIDFDLKRDGT